MNPERLDAALLARRLRGPLSAAERPRETPGALLAAAVLVPLLPGADGAELLYMRRADELPDHSGQVAFPGGIREEGDPDLYATALRESVEEVGVPPGQVIRVGALAPVTTLEKYLIQPYLSLWPDAQYAPASPREVERVFRVPLVWLLDPRSCIECEVAVASRILKVPAWRFDGEVIWGATRRITLELLEHLRGVI